MDALAATVRAAFVSGYRPYLVRRLAELELDEPNGWDEAVAAGEIWLAESLEGLLTAPAAMQSRGPLEVFQEAMRFPTGALAAAGVAPAARDTVAAAALPGDGYDLAPASSQALGEDAWRAHLAWGAAKAAALAADPPSPTRPAPPSVGLLSTDLMDRSKIEPVVVAAGLRLAVWLSAGQIATPGLVTAFVDLRHPDALAVISRLAGRTHTVAFGAHVDDAVFTAAQEAGAALVLARSVFFRRLPELIPRLV